MTGEKPEEETYSLIYTSLKHPIRRKILRMLKEQPSTFSEILNAVGIDSGHLSYHLENLGDLITHTKDGKYQLTSIGEAAVKLMGGVEEHSRELSKPKLRLNRIFAKVYPFVLSGALIIAGLYFTGYTTIVTRTTNGIGFIIPNANITTVNATTTPANQTVIVLSPVNVTSINATGPINMTGITLGWAVTLKNLNITVTWEEHIQPYFYYGVGTLIIALVYPIAFLIGVVRDRKHRLIPQNVL